MAVVRLEFFVHPPKIEHGVDLAHKMIKRHDLVQTELVEQLALASLSPTHHRPLPLLLPPRRRNHGSAPVSMSLLQHAPVNSWPYSRAALAPSPTQHLADGGALS